MTCTERGGDIGEVRMELGRTEYRDIAIREKYREGLCEGHATEQTTRRDNERDEAT